MTLLLGHSSAVARWVGERIPYGGDFGPCQAVGVLSRDEGRLLAGVVYHEYQPDFRSVQLSIASDSPMWARRSNIAGLLSIPFLQMNCYRAWLATPIDNTRALKVNEHIGFTREAVCHSAFGEGRHGVLMRMLRPEFDKLFCEVADGQESPKTAAAA